MKEIKYLYFEIKYITGVDPTTPSIKNENILLIKPNTNSSGIWGFRNVTERKGFSKPTFSIVEQNWIDLNKYKFGTKTYEKLDKQVKTVLTKLKEKL